jgi:hypothetical protein
MSQEPNPVPITGLPLATSISTTDIMIIVQDGITKQGTVGLIDTLQQVSYSQLPDMTGPSFIGRDTGTGSPGELTFSGQFEISANTLFVNLAGTVTSVGLSSTTPDITVTGSPITSAGEFRITLEDTTVSAGVYGTSTIIPQITVDSKGRITGVSRTTIPSFAVSIGMLGGTNISVGGSPVSAQGQFTLDLTNTGVVGGTYGTSTQIPRFTVDAKGRITSATDISIEFPVSEVSIEVSGGNGVSVGGSPLGPTGKLEIRLNNTGVSAGTYGAATAVPQITVDAQGRITNVTRVSISAGGGGSGTVTSVGLSLGTGIVGSVTNPTGDARINLALDNSGVTPNVYGDANIVPQITVDTYGRVTNITPVSISTNPGTVTSVGLSLTDLQGTVTNPNSEARINLSLTATGVSAGTYGTSTIVPAFTVDSKGRITGVTRTTIAATGGGTVTSVGLSTGTGLTGSVTNPNGDARVNIGLTSSGVVSATYGGSDGRSYSRVQVDGFGRVVSATDVSISAPSSFLTLNNGGGINFGISYFGGNIATVIVGLSTTGVVSATYGTSTIIPRIEVNQYGRVVNITEVTIPPLGVGTVTSVGVSSQTLTATVDNPTGDARINIELTSIGGLFVPGVYGNINGRQYPIIALDDFGRVIEASTIDISAVASIGLSLTDLAGTVTNPNGDARINLSLTATGVSAGTYGTSTIVPQIVVDSKGRITNIVRTTVPSGGTVTSVGISLNTTDLQGTVTSPTAQPRINLSLAPTAVSAGTYGSGTITPQFTLPRFTVDTKGRITNADRVSVGPFVTSVGMSATDIGFSINNPNGDVRINLSLDPTGVTPAEYGSVSVIPQITVDSKGRITAVSASPLITRGSWTPSPYGTVTSGTATGTFNGQYVKIGPKVDCWGQIVLTGWSGAVGNFVIGGLPFTVANAAVYRGGGSIGLKAGVSTALPNWGIYAAENTDRIAVTNFSQTAGGATAFLSVGAVTTSTNLYFHISYLTE